MSQRKFAPDFRFDFVMWNHSSSVVLIITRSCAIVPLRANREEFKASFRSNKRTELCCSSMFSLFPFKIHSYFSSDAHVNVADISWS